MHRKLQEGHLRQEYQIVHRPRQIVPFRHQHQRLKLVLFIGKKLFYFKFSAQKSTTSSGTGSQSTGRRRGFGAFAGSVQPPAIVLPLPAVSFTQPKSASSNASGVTTPAVTAPGLVIPQLGSKETVVFL